MVRRHPPKRSVVRYNMPMIGNKQVNADHYGARYMHLKRWSSYFFTIHTILCLKPASVLEIGKGDGTVGDYLKKCGIPYTSADHAEDLSPDLVVDVRDMSNIKDASYDVVIACQVLEHLPFSDVPLALKELARIAKRYVVLDIPQKGFHIQFAFKFPCLPYVMYNSITLYPFQENWYLTTTFGK